LERKERIAKKQITPPESVLTKIEAVKEKKKKLKIIKAIARGNTPWAPQVLLDALDEPCQEICDFIINELGQRENLDIDMIHQKLLTSPWNVKSAILKILGIRKNPLSIKHIEFVLKEPNADVRRSAARALGEIGGKDALALLVRLTKDKNHYVKVLAEEALRKVSDLKFC